MKISKILSYSTAFAIAGAVVVGAVYLRGVRAEQHAQVAPPEQTPWALHSTKVKQETVTSGFLALATKKADSEVLVSPQISGTIIAMGPREGQPFQPGTLLARIDASQINEEIDALKATLQATKQQEKFLKRELDRQKTLLKKGFTTEEKTESARTSYIAAREKVTATNHQLAQLKTRRSYAMITTDKSGTVAARLAEPGNLAAPGKPIYRLTVSGKTRFTVKVPQSVLENLKIGGPVELTSGSKKIAASVTRINHTLDNLSMGSLDIDLAAAPFNLPAGARLPARVITGQVKNALSVPITAIAWSADGKSGFIVKVAKKGDATVLKKILVTVLQSSTDGAAIKGDVRAGDRVVVAQQAVLLKLQTGDAATVAEGVAQ